MTEEITLDGMKVAPAVLDTIVTLAVESVDGVACSSSGQGIGGLMNRAAGKAVDFSLDESGQFAVAVHITAVYGMPLRDTAVRVQAEVADAIKSQVGVAVSSVDVYIDDIEFPE